MLPLLVKLSKPKSLPEVEFFPLAEVERIRASQAALVPSKVVCPPRLPTPASGSSPHRAVVDEETTVTHRTPAAIRGLVMALSMSTELIDGGDI